MEAALLDLWNAAVKGIAWRHGSGDLTGIAKFWSGLEQFEPHYEELGSPVGPERREGDNVYQAFAHGIVKWAPDGPSIL